MEEKLNFTPFHSTPGISNPQTAPLDGAMPPVELRSPPPDLHHRKNLERNPKLPFKIRTRNYL